MLETTYQLPPGCRGGNPSPVDTYDTKVQIFCFINPFTLDFVEMSVLTSYRSFVSVSKYFSVG
jgi:hypothetical protein